MFLKLILLFCGVALAYASRSPAEIKQWLLSKSVDCTKDNSLSSKELQMLLNHELPGTKPSKCFIACLFKQVEWINEKGEFDLEKNKAMMAKEYDDNPTHLENAHKLFDICSKVNAEAVTDGTAGCDRANSLAQCLIDNAPKLGFNIDGI